MSVFVFIYKYLTNIVWFYCTEKKEGAIVSLIIVLSVVREIWLIGLVKLIYLPFCRIGPVYVCWDEWRLPQVCVCVFSYRLFFCVLLYFTACMLYYCNTVGWAWWDWGLIWWLTIVLQCFDTVGWVTWAVKISSPNDLYCVEWDVKPYSTQLNSYSLFTPSTWTTQNCLVLSCPCRRCEHNCRQDKTVLSCLNPVFNLQLFSLKCIED